MSDLWSVAVPTWLSSVGTVGAFASGGVLLMRELQRDRRREEQQQRAVAGLVAAWPTRVETRTATATTVETRVQLRNGGTEPVYQVILQYLPAGGGGEPVRDEVGILPPGDTQRELPDALRETWIRADREWVRRSAEGLTESTDPLREPWRFTVAMQFVDAADRRWRRRTNGSLELAPAGADSE